MTHKKELRFDLKTNGRELDSEASQKDQDLVESPPGKAAACNQKVVSKEKAAWIEAILGFNVSVEAGTQWDEVITYLASKLSNTQQSRKNLECTKAFAKFLDSYSPRPKTPKTGKEKAELLVSLVRK